MKKIILFLLAFITFATFNSCREDGEWNENSQFGFSIDRDSEFIEKAVGEQNQLKFNIISNYEFSSVPMKFKFTTNLNGSLKLNGLILTQNQEYNLNNKDNIFEYIGNVAGTHDLKITAFNEKGNQKIESFSLKYGVSEFAHSYTGGTGDIYQGDETIYSMKIVPSQGQPSTGYQIKFNSYNGEIKLNGVPAQVGTYYNLPNIDNFTLILKNNNAGQNVLHYSIKNNTVTKDYSIQQQIKQREIIIQSMNINSNNFYINEQVKFSGYITKTPTTNNTNIQYKTWISSASNSNLNGIESTNNVYTNYALGSNGAFLLNINTLVPGNYTYNIQVKDEFGNESIIKSFDIIITPQIYFDTSIIPEGDIAISPNYAPSSIYFTQQYFKRKFKVIAAANLTITAIKYEINYTVNLNSETSPVTRVYNEFIPSGTTTYEKNNEIWQTQSDVASFNNNNLSNNNISITNRVFKITATASNGVTVTHTFEPTATIL